ncbi:MAG TPA: hypothetical protein VHL53_24075, partial [Acidimicrobiia bacterium]|nr:hypothetical protein [Acidimicrobiia bacterium]
GLATGVAGVTLAALVAGAHTLALRRRVDGRKVALLAGWLAPAQPVAAPTSMVLIADGLSRYHVEGCPALGRAPTTRIARTEVGDRSPCGICGAG